MADKGEGPARGGLLSAYLMVGTDEAKVRLALDRLDARLAASGDAAFNRDAYDGASAPEPAALRASLDTLPFGADFRLVVINGVDQAPKPVTEAIVAYLKDPCPTTVLAMTAQKLARTTRLYKAVAACGEKAVIDCSARKRWELPPYVCRMAARHGKRMDSDAAELLVRYVGESTAMLESEIVKLAAAVGDAPQITEADVRALVTPSAEVKPWDFLDAVSRRDAAAAMQQLARMPSQSPIGLETLLVTRIRQLIAAKALAARGQGGTAALAAELGLKAWQVKNYPAWASRYTMGELVGALRGACACDAALKGSGSGDPTLALQRWVLSFCPPAASR